MLSILFSVASPFCKSDTEALEGLIISQKKLMTDVTDMTDVNDLSSVTWQAGWLRWMDAIRDMSSMIVVLFQISLLAAKNPSKWMGRLEWHSDAILTFLGKAFTEEVMIFICSGCKRNLTSQNWPQNKQHCLLSQWSNKLWGRQAPPPPSTICNKIARTTPLPPHSVFRNSWML